MANNKAIAMQFLLGKGLTRQQAAGVVGSLMQESGLSPTITNRSSGAYGIGQWLGPRKTNLLNSGKSGLRGQLDFLWSELQGSENAALKSLKGAHTVADAVNAFTWGFERPGRSEANIPNRVNQARAALGLGDTGGTGGGSTGGGGTTTTTPKHLTFDATPATAQMALAQRPQRQITTPPPLAFAAQPVSTVPATTQPQTPQTAQTDAPVRFQAGAALEALNALQQAQGTTTVGTVGGDTVSTQAGGGGGGGAPITERKGVANFGGKPVAAWIKPILQYARSQGWKGGITSGYRSLADQTRIYNSGVRPAAKPGTSNHEFTAFPGGAIDVSDAQTLSNILRHSKYAKTLVYAGGKDPVHFSHPHDGGY